MAGFKQPDFIERQEAAAKARKVALEKFHAKAADPALAERLIARAARAAERSAIKTTREIERAEKEVREVERAQQAERDAVIEVERAKAESAERERALQASRTKGGQRRPLRRPQIATETPAGSPTIWDIRISCTRFDSVREFLEGPKHPEVIRLFPLVACCLTEMYHDEARKIFDREHLRADKTPRNAQTRDRSKDRPEYAGSRTASTHPGSAGW